MPTDGRLWYPGWLWDRIRSLLGRGGTSPGGGTAAPTATLDLSGLYPVIHVAGGTPGGTAQLWANAQNVDSTGTGLYDTNLSAPIASDGTATITDTGKTSTAARQYGTYPGVVRDSITGLYSNWVQPW
jgi:hypothetical protein